MPATTLPWSSTHATPPRNGPTYSLIIALTLHLALVFGLRFEATPHREYSTRQLEITLLRTQVAPKPAPEPEYLAPTHQQGGMEAPPEATRIIEAAPVEQPPAAQAASPPPAVQRRTVPQLSQRTPASHSVPAAQAHTPPPLETALPTSGQLLTKVQTINEQEAELQESLALYSQRPRAKYVTANTQEYVYASYMDAWRRKVERLGRLHYPDAARRQKLYGSPMLDVVINPDGSLYGIELLRSSGHTVLDDAAIQIARLGAPYAPFPAAVRAEADVLHIVRTWKFGKGSLLTGAN